MTVQPKEIIAGLSEPRHGLDLPESTLPSESITPQNNSFVTDCTGTLFKTNMTVQTKEITAGLSEPRHGLDLTDSTLRSKTDTRLNSGRHKHLNGASAQFSAPIGAFEPRAASKRRYPVGNCVDPHGPYGNPFTKGFNRHQRALLRAKLLHFSDLAQPHGGINSTPLEEFFTYIQTYISSTGAQFDMCLSLVSFVSSVYSLVYCVKSGGGFFSKTAAIAGCCSSLLLIINTSLREATRERTLKSFARAIITPIAGPAKEPIDPTQLANDARAFLDEFFSVQRVDPPNCGMGVAEQLASMPPCEHNTPEEYVAAAKDAWKYAHRSYADNYTRFVAALEWFSANPTHPDIDAMIEVPYSKEPKHQLEGTLALTRLRKTISYDGEDNFAHAQFDYRALGPMILNLCTILALISMRFFAVDISAFAKLVRDKNTLQREFASMADLVNELLSLSFGISMSSDVAFVNRLTSLIEEGKAFSTLSPPDYYERKNYSACTSWLDSAEEFITTARKSTSLMQSPGIHILQSMYATTKVCFDECRRSRQNACTRIEPVVIQLNGTKGVGKSHLTPQLVRWIAERTNLSPDIYNLNMNGFQYFPAYGNQAFMVIDEFLANDNDALKECFNTLASTTPFKMEGASLAEKNQWCNVSFIIVITNEVRKSIKGLSPLVEEALYSRLTTVEVQFADQKLDNPRSAEGRSADYSHLRFTYRKFIRNGGNQQGSGPFLEISSQPISLQQLVDDACTKYYENLANFKTRQDGSAFNVAPPATIGPPLHVPVVRGIGNQFCEAHGATLPFTVVCSGAPGSGKTYFAREHLSRTLALYFNMDVVELKSLSERYSKPAIYIIDDLLCDDTIHDYMSFTNGCPHGSIIWICTNIDVKWTKEMKGFGPNWLYGIWDPYYSVDIKCGSYSGVLRRLSLCGNIHSRDEKHSCFVTHIERNGLHFKFSKAGTRVMVNELGTKPSENLTNDDIMELVREAKMDYDKMSGGITYLYDDISERALLDSDREWDLQFSFPSLAVASDVLTNCNTLLVHWTSGSSIKIADGVIEKIGHGGREAATWVAPFPATTAEHFRQLAIHYTRKLWQVSRDLSAKFVAGPYSCTFRNGVANIIGVKGVSVEGHSTDGTKLIISFEGDGQYIEASIAEFFMLVNGPAPDRFAFYSIPKVCAAKAYLQSLSGNATDPLFDIRMQSIRDTRVGMWSAFCTGMQVSFVKLITKYPLFTTLAALFAAGVGLVYMWHKLFSGPPQAEKERREALEYLAAMQGRMNEDDTPSISEFIRANKEFEYLMREHPSDYRSAITRYWRVFSICYRTHPHGARRKVVNSYGDEKNTRKEHAKTRSKKDLEQIYTDANMVSPEFARHCRDNNMHFTKDAFARFVEDPVTFTWTEDEHNRFSIISEAHLVSGVTDTNPTQLNSWAHRISKSTCMVSTQSLAGKPLRVHGLCIGGDRILTVAHIVRDYQSPLTITITKADPEGRPEERVYAAEPIFINRSLELALLVVRDPRWQPMSNIRHLFAPSDKPVPIYGHSVKPAVGGTVSEPKSNIISSHYLMAVNNPNGEQMMEFKSDFDCIPIRVNGPSYVAAYSDSKAHTLGRGDCGTVILATSNHDNRGPIFGMYIGVCGISPYWVRCDSASLSSLETMARERELCIAKETQAHGLMLSGKVKAGDVEFLSDYPHSNILHPDKKEPLCDLSSMESEDGGVVGFLSRDATKERPWEKPCRTRTMMDPDFLPSKKVPAPVHISQVEDPSGLKEIPAGLYAGTRSLVAGQCLEHFNAKRAVPHQYYARAIDELYNKLPAACLNFGIKDLDMVLNGGHDNDLWGSERSSPNLNTHPGYIYEAMFSMTNKHRFFYCESVDGKMVAKHPLIIDERPNGPGAYLMERYRAIWAAALRGESLLCLGKNFIKRELISSEKASRGVVRTVEVGDFALTLFMDSVLADFYERRRNSDGDHMVIGRDMRLEGNAIVRHLFQMNSKQCVALDVSKWDRSTSQETLSGAIKLAFKAARASDNYDLTPEEIDNVEKAVIAYTTVPISIIHDCVYWTRGRMPSGCRFTAEFNTDGHAIMRRAGFYHYLETNNVTRRELPHRDLYSECVAEIIYGDDVLFSLADKKWLKPEIFTELYRHIGYIVTNDRKDGDPCLTTYEEASFCSRFILRDEGRVDMALKKESIASLLHWTSIQEASHIVDVAQSAALESVVWGRDFYESVSKNIRIMSARYGIKLHLPTYDNAMYFIRNERPQQLTFQSQCSAHGGPPDGMVRLEFATNNEVNRRIEPTHSCPSHWLDQFCERRHWLKPQYEDLGSTQCTVCGRDCFSASMWWFPMPLDANPHEDDLLAFRSEGCHEHFSFAKESVALIAISHLNVILAGQEHLIFQAHGGSDIISGPNPVFVLNELCVRNKWDEPKYNLLAKAGPPHEPLFAYSVEVKGRAYSPSLLRFKTKKSAMKSAAYVCLTQCPDIQDSWKTTYSAMFSDYKNNNSDINLKPNGYRCTVCYEAISGATSVALHAARCSARVWFRVIRGTMEDVSLLDDPPRIIEVEECTTQCEAHGGDALTQAADITPMNMPSASSREVAPTANDNNMQPGSGTILSEGPEVAINFLGPVGSQPIELMNMVGAMNEHYVIARDIFIDTQTPTRKITSENKRGTIIQVFSYLDSSNWSGYMIEQAKLNELCGGGVLYQIETHGPATNGGCLRAVWLPYTPTSQSINIPMISQYPYVEIPMGGDHVNSMCLFDSKLTPQVRRVAEFFTDFDKTITCSIVVYVDQELNNGYNVGSTEENKLFMQYVIRAKFGPYWVMGRGKTMEGIVDPLIGRSLAQLTGSPGNRFAVGNTAEFTPLFSAPCRSLTTMLRQVTGVSFRCDTGAVARNNASVTSDPTSAADAYLLRMNDDLMGLNVAFTFTNNDTKFFGYIRTPDNTYIDNDNAELSGGKGWSETIYTNTQLPFSYPVYFSTDKSTTCRVRNIRVMGTINDENVFLVTLETEISFNQLPTTTSYCTLDGAGLSVAISAFMSSNFTFAGQPSNFKYSVGILGYKPLCFTEDAYPSGGDYMATVRDQNFMNYVGKYVEQGSVIVLASPTRPNLRIPVIYNGVFLACNADPYQISLTDVDDYVVVATGAFSVLSSVESVSSPTNPYNLEPNSYFYRRGRILSVPEPIIDFNKVDVKLWANRGKFGVDVKHDSRFPLIKEGFNFERAFVFFANLYTAWKSDNRRYGNWNKDFVFKKLQTMMAKYDEFRGVAAHAIELSRTKRLEGGGDEICEDEIPSKSGDELCEAHAAIAEVLGLALSGVGQGVSDVVKSKREQRYALQRMHASFENNLALANNSARLRREMMYAEKGLDAYSVNKGMNGHTMDYNAFTTDKVKGAYVPPKVPTIGASTKVKGGRPRMPLDVKMDEERPSRRITERHNYRKSPPLDNRRVTTKHNYDVSASQAQPRDQNPGNSVESEA